MHKFLEQSFFLCASYLLNIGQWLNLLITELNFKTICLSLAFDACFAIWLPSRNMSEGEKSLQSFSPLIPAYALWCWWGCGGGNRGGGGS